MARAPWVAVCSAVAVLAVLAARRHVGRAKALPSTTEPVPCAPGVLFIFGLGYTGERFAREMLAAGWTVWGTVRSREALDRLTALGVGCVLWTEPLDRDAVGRVLQTVTHLLVTAAPTETGDPMLAQVTGLLTILPGLQWVGYLSTVGVYGDAEGAAVDEETPVKPLSERGRRRVRAEQQWLQTGLPVHIFRLPGIYGPGRGPLAKVRDRTARRVVKPGHVFSRIHVDDIGTALRASIARPRPGAVYNVVDDEPAPGHVVTEYACRLLGAPLPPLVDFESADLTPMARSFYSESRFMTNRLLKEELGVTLRYPTYREGFQAQLDEERRSGVAAPPPPSPRRGAWHGLGRLFHRVAAPRPATVPPRPVVLLLDNGSLRAASTLSLRATASALEAVLQADPTKPVAAVFATSVRFSDRVSPDALHGQRAALALPLLRQLVQRGQRQFVVLPFFFGPSSSIYGEVVDQLRGVRQEHPDVEVEIAPPLVCRCPFLFPSTKGYGDDVIAAALYDNVMAVVVANGLLRPAVVMVDHGSPQPAVGRVRSYVAAKLAVVLRGQVASFAESSMERRDGPEYDFNDPLLRAVLDRDDYAGVPVVVALMFLSPGKHAGPDGDIAQIIKASNLGARSDVFMTDVLGSHPKLLPLLADRHRQALSLDVLPVLDET
eukprot:EG_transcript_4491